MKTRKRECFSSSSSSFKIEANDRVAGVRENLFWKSGEKDCGDNVVVVVDKENHFSPPVNCIVSGHYHCARCCLFCVFIQMANESKAHLLLYFLVMRQRRRRQLHASTVQCCTVDSGRVIWCNRRRRRRRRRRIVLQALVKHTHIVRHILSFSPIYSW